MCVLRHHVSRLCYGETPRTLYCGSRSITRGFKCRMAQWSLVVGCPAGTCSKVSVLSPATSSKQWLRISYDGGNFPLPDRSPRMQHGLPHSRAGLACHKPHSSHKISPSILAVRHYCVVFPLPSSASLPAFQSQREETKKRGKGGWA
jgi:hypothetical protein